jgi:hypothetical protein
MPIGLFFCITFVLAATFTARADIQIVRQPPPLDFSDRGTPLDTSGLIPLKSQSPRSPTVKSQRPVGVYITNAITEGDAKALQDISGELENLGAVWLDSTGGDVFAAMQIGRLIRKHELATWIAVPARCYSSCALIFIAGVKRTNFGQIGLHRPYLASAPQSRQLLEKQIPFLLSQIKAYVSEMGITDNFYQQIVNTEPSQMVTYGWSDYRTLVPENDPTYDEVRISYEARSYGVTTSEMRQREEDAEQCYKLAPAGTSQFLMCYEARMWGLSERVYRERQQKVSRACVLRDDEGKIIDAIPRRDRKDHPIWIRMESCVRNIMLHP